MKIFLKLNDRKDRYWMFEGAQTQNYMLQYLHSSLEQELFEIIKKFNDGCQSINWEGLRLDLLNKNTILLWHFDYIKGMANIDFKTKQEMEDYYKAYSEYSDKRWDDMPKLEMSLQNYQEILEKWETIKEAKPEYIIFSQDDQGYVDLIGKNELSQEDIADMKTEHQKFLKRQKAWKKYIHAHPNRSEVWRSPEDSEFEADWQKYLED